MIKVGILGATGSVGRKFAQLLRGHPWFELIAVAASERSIGLTYNEATAGRVPSEFSHLQIQPCTPNLPVSIVFSALDASVAGEIETSFANAGYFVASNCRNHRMDPLVPLLVPEINADHLALLGNDGRIVTTPNCSTVGLAMALKPLLDRFGLEQVHVVTMQAVSGAGDVGAKAMNIEDNIIPYISGEEGKIESEPLKILGAPSLRISAQSNRVHVSDGHTLCVSVKLSSRATPGEMIDAWNSFKSIPGLPSSPTKPIYYFSEDNFPQPKLHRDLEGGMAISIGRLRPCSLFDYKFVVLSHNTIRGAAGGAILNAELVTSLSCK